MTPLAFTQLIEPIFPLAESPVYDDRANALLFCDIPAGAIHSVDLVTRKVTTFNLPPPVGSFGLAQSGRLVVALRDRVVLFDRASGESRLLAEIGNAPETRLNDGKVGPDGAYWVGSMDMVEEARPLGSLYRVTPDGRVEKKLDGIIVSNGIAFSPDGGALYYADTIGGWIDRWRLDAKTGAMSGRERFATPDEATGAPDGAAVDAEGCYWSAAIFAARINRFSPQGALLESHPAPGAVTMPCFSGADLKTMFVTSLRVNRTPEFLARYPLTGGVFVAQARVAGAPVARFADKR